MAKIASRENSVRKQTKRGISERKEYVTNIRATCRIKVQIREQTFLVSRILREYGRKERKSSTRICEEPRKRRYAVRADKYKRIYGSVQSR